MTGNRRAEADGWRPEFEGQRPPWAEGNEYRWATNSG
jgi:hypothetical protein